MYLFVYGSLLSHNSNNYLLNGCKFIGKAVLEGYGLYKVSWYPAIVPKEGSKVAGEVYEVDETLIKEIDDFEDEGELYRRQEVDVILNDNKVIKAWTYVYLLDVDEKNYISFEKQPWRE
ncbi:gamma-glutamylcyclotransferase family protein [Caldicellulosiruptor acetigenus]|uniref:gamma-glutamylcyclotransferase family protein n=1 Tax=Caldicellulosiruptor acetigenus TaxID=301953 RepID=UPI0003FBCF58|nr:gamma-glutamylcyclotransferase family protein [Caldicellulosiruptor acetigenus]WAM36708.1 gamma-glutamylcyclotransferase [Caldicellulosiruptor acetigenus]